MIYKISQSDTKLQATIAEVDKLRKKKGLNVSALIDRISALEATVEAQQQELARVDESVGDVEKNLSIWAEKEFDKVYDILNDNPLGN